MKDFKKVFVAISSVVIWLSTSQFQHVHALTLEEELTITKAQYERLKEFKELMIPQLPHAYMKEEIYLIRWLRAKNFNLKAARIALLENLKWREENKLDTILSEDWSDMEAEYQYTLEGCDREGRPIVGAYVGDWDVRRAVLSGKSKRLMRYFDKLMEQITVLVRNTQERGFNVTQHNHIFEMANFDTTVQGCLNCVPVYIHLFQSYQNHFPGTVNKIIMVNTPTVFESLWALIKPVITNNLLKTISIYGRNRSQWIPQVEKHFDLNQVTKNFGGTKENPLDLFELLGKGYLTC